MALPPTKHARRRSVLVWLSDLLRPVCADLDTRWKIVTTVERGCFNSAIRRCKLDQQSTAWENPYFERMYGVYAMDLLGHLSNESIPVGWRFDLARRLCANPSMSTECLIPAANEATRREMVANELALQEETGKIVGTNLYKCPKCGARNADAGMKQTRAADEGATVLVECLECGAKFRG